SPREAFYNTFTFDQACLIQLEAYQSGRQILLPDDVDIISAAYAADAEAGVDWDGSREWPGWIRMLDRTDPSYRDRDTGGVRGSPVRDRLARRRIIADPRRSSPAPPPTGSAAPAGGRRRAPSSSRSTRCFPAGGSGDNGFLPRRDSSRHISSLKEMSGSARLSEIESGAMQMGMLR
ncbi:MAG TPA: hypothetical protein VLA10_00805, partial [Ilumatobacter sp.]|nr:hypothetical protein [Ilumatobacter sp.]